MLDVGSDVFDVLASNNLNVMCVLAAIKLFAVYWDNPASRSGGEHILR